MTITLIGETPSKKNSRINTRSGRSFPSQRYMQWHDSVVCELRCALSKKQLTSFSNGIPLSFTVTFYHSDMRRRDSDNQLSSILDTLVDVGIIPDDKWTVLPEKHIYDRYDKENPRCVIKISEFSGSIK